MNTHTSTEVAALPKCDYCNKLAAYDAKTCFGPWANLCHEHYVRYGVGLGLGKGQKLIIKETAE